MDGDNGGKEVDPKKCRLDPKFLCKPELEIEGCNICLLVQLRDIEFATHRNIGQLLELSRPKKIVNFGDLKNIGRS